MFNEIIRNIVDEAAGGVGAVLMGYDGIAIAQFFHPYEGADLQMVAVEYANILKEIRKTAEILEAGAVEEVCIKSQKFHVVIRSVHPDYFVALTLQWDGNFGKGRYLLMREAPRIRKALEL